MKKILKWIILLLIIGILIYTINGIYQENKIKKGENNKNTQENIQIATLSAETEKSLINTNNLEINTNKSKTNNEVETKLVPEKYKGKEVIAKLKIEKLDIDTCVLKNYSKANLDICVTKFFGPKPNEVGNFCIAGHNYITKNMFGYLKWLKVGNTLTLTDNIHGEVKYKIYDIYRAEANETQRTNSKNKWKKRSYTNYML